jgi:putative transposase
MVGPQARREGVTVLIQERGYGVTRACGLLGISRSLYGYRSCRAGSQEVAARLKELAAVKRRYGYRRLHVLLRREGFTVNR